MVQELERVHQGDFPETAPTANPVFYRTYSRKTETGRETWREVCDRTINGLRKLGQLTPEETDLLYRMQSQLKALSSGRWLWVGGTDWITQQQNFSGAYNCSSTNIIDWRSFGLLMDLAMMGCGTGAVLEPRYINQLPPIRNHLNVVLRGEVGSTPCELRRELTEVKFHQDQAEIFIGDSRQGWVGAYQALLELSSDERFSGKADVIIDLNDVRPAGERLKGFGGVANPVKLPELYQRCGNILNRAVGRQLNSVECCLLIDEAAACIVAGNIRRSAGIRQGLSSDRLFAVAKDNLWRQDENGNWGIDPNRDALRMANHTHVFHHKPTLEECVEAVRKQFYSGEGAIQWAGEAVARANRDLLSTTEIKRDFLKAYGENNAKKWFQEHYPNISNDELEHRLARLGLNPCHSGDTLVSTDQGLIPIQDLVGKQFKALVDLRSVGLSGVKLTDAIAFATGVKTTYKVMLTNGMQMRCTADHQHFTSRGWVSTQDLTDDDNIYVQRGAGHFGKGTISVAQAQMLGWWYGDGFNVRIKARSDGHGRKQDHFAKGFVFNQDEYETADNIVGKAVITTAKEYVTTLHKGVYEFRTQSPKLEKFFADLGILGKEELPHNFLSQSQEVLIGFLQGIFSANGSVDKDYRRIKLAMVSEKILQQIQLILSNLGIISTVRLVREKGDRGVSYRTVDGTEKIRLDQGSYGLFISTFNFDLFQELIGFSLCQNKGVKAEKWLLKPLPNYSESTINSKFTSKVKKVEEFGEEVVYDLHVPLTNSFIANGCLTHNCGEIIGANFHCVSEDTLLITRDSIHKIKDIVGQKVEVWNGKNWSQVIPLKTGKYRKLYRVKFGDGSYLDVTEYHRFFVKDRFGKNYQEVQTKDLLTHSKYTLHTEPFVIDYRDGNSINSYYAYKLGVAIGKSENVGWVERSETQHAPYSSWVYPADKLALTEYLNPTYGDGNDNTKIRQYNYLPTFVDVTDLGFSGELLRRLQTEPDALNIIASWNKPAILAFIAGLADTDGSNTKSNGIRIYLSDYERAKRLQLLLTKCGIRASVNLMASSGSTTNLGTKNKDLYYLQITDCREIPCQRLDTSKGCEPKFKGKNQTIESVEELPGLHDTYCFEEPEFHKGVFGNTLTGNCNLSEIHLNQIDPNNHKEQEEAFTAGALSVATLLNHKFLEPRYNYSRELDPIVGVSFTGLFDFFVKAFGIEWLHWWQAGRPKTTQGLEFKEQEAKYLSRWREIVHQVVWDYCDHHNLKRPNRCTTVQPSGCLDKTALRIFNQGLLYADEIVAPGSGETVGLELTVRNGIGASTAIANQPLELVEVKLANGRTLRMTPNHRMSVAGKWVHGCDLKPGMLLDYSIGEYDKQEDALLIPLQLENYTRVKRSQTLGHNRGVLTEEIVTPATLTPDLAYFIGCLFGNGCISEHKYRICFSHSRLDILYRLQEKGKKLFGIAGNINDLGNGRFELSFASRQLFDWFHLNQLAKTEKSQDLDRIPMSLRRSSRVTLLSFFCGLIDTDGCVRKQGNLSIDSASSDFIGNLQQIGEAIGLCFSIFENIKGENLQPQQKDMWGLCLSRMLSNADALDYLNEHSIKCQERPLLPPKRVFSFSPYKIESVNIGAVCDYSYDFAIEGIDDNDSWYWQGALKSHNTKSLLTNAAPGWHPPFGLRWVRRITFAKNDPVALACLDYGYSVIPGQSSKDENGNLLNDPFDDRAKEWLVEIPVQVSWIDLPGIEEIAIEKFSATAMFDFYMVVQSAWTTHNSSSTILLTEEEIEPLGKSIYEAIRDDEGYISSALLARFDAPFPRLPFERISKEEYEKLEREVLQRRKSDDFSELMNGYVLASDLPEMGPQDPACSGMVCELKGSEPEVK
ncbi:LAGLIDADG family homing endonuclease [Okeania sp.]|uniref:LAGLIDADG family homing endonuclease n=1 Tax=Okeania sp. TaxID=3100323 RepID=UPI002B4B8A53|nr:LAGLIDADG family homing endonuclease [Okeania sp.]MEB3340439.1 LAGLIDADG family homing endonuclease [Okeania sp.]